MKRVYMLGVRLTETERATFAKLAELHEMSLSEYARQACRYLAGMPSLLIPKEKKSAAPSEKSEERPKRARS